MSAARERFARENKIAYRVFTADELNGFPEPPPMPSAPRQKKVVVTGSYDWLHSGHVRFFEEFSAYGDLYVIIVAHRHVHCGRGDCAAVHGPHRRRPFDAHWHGGAVGLLRVHSHLRSDMAETDQGCGEQ